MDCSICLDTLENQCTYKLSCGHIFHFECIDYWYRRLRLEDRSCTCPICRRVIENWILEKINIVII